MNMPKVKMSRSEWAELAILVLIVAFVFVASGAASFTHVHDWTLRNSPQGTADWFGWVNAVISELVPIASLIMIRRIRRRNPHAPITFPMTLLVAGIALSLNAQLSEAEQTLSGRIASAVPAIAFLALAKLVFSRIKTEPSETEPVIPQHTPAPIVVPAPASVPASTVASTVPVQATSVPAITAIKTPEPLPLNGQRRTIGPVTR